MPGEGFLQDMRRLTAARQGPIVVIERLIAIGRIDAIVDDDFRAFARGKCPQIGEAVFGHQNIDVMFVVVAMGDHGNDGRDGAVLGCRLGHEDRHIGVTREIARTADAVHHMRAIDMGGIDIAINVAFQRRIDGDDAEAADDFRMIADLLRTQDQAILVFGDMGEESVGDGLAECHRRARGEDQLAGIEQGYRAVLQHLAIHGQLFKGAMDQSIENGIGDIADAGLKRVEAIAEPSLLDFIRKEVGEMSGNGNGFRVRRGERGGTIEFVCENNGRYIVGIDRNGMRADPAVAGDDRNGIAKGPFARNIDVVQALELGGMARIELDDDLLGGQSERRGIADRSGRHDAAVLGDCHRLDDRDIDGLHLMRAQEFDRFRKMLVDEQDVALIDRITQSGV